MNIGYCKFCLKCREDMDSVIAPCIQKDDMPDLLLKIKDADGFILACPTSGGHPSALMKTFIERSCFTLGRPTGRILWVKGCPESRIAYKQRYAIIITTAGVVPGWSKAFCGGAITEMREHAEFLFNARIIGTLFAGMINVKGLEDRSRKRARQLGEMLSHSIVKEHRARKK